MLVFSGEEFPEPGTVQRLKERGHEFDSDWRLPIWLTSTKKTHHFRRD